MPVGICNRELSAFIIKYRINLIPNNDIHKNTINQRLKTALALGVIGVLGAARTRRLKPNGLARSLAHCSPNSPHLDHYYATVSVQAELDSKYLALSAIKGTYRTGLFTPYVCSGYCAFFVYVVYLSCLAFFYAFTRRIEIVVRYISG